MPSSGSSDSSSSQSSIDQDEVNSRVAPDWSRYRDLLESSGFQLDTYRDVRKLYEMSPWFRSLSQDLSDDIPSGYSRVCRDYEEDALCRDEGLVGIPSRRLPHTHHRAAVSTSPIGYFVDTVSVTGNESWSNAYICTVGNSISSATSQVP